jgi:transcription antitermination factor NusG
MAAVTQTGARWFAVYTSSRHEKWVMTNLMQRQIESFLPLFEKVHHWSKRAPVRLKLPLFPNYVFVRIPPNGRNSVLAVPGVVAIVGRGNIVSPLPDDEIETLRTRLEQGKFEPHPYLVAGERVRVCGGALEGIEGIVVRRKNEVRVVLTLELIQRSVAVEVDTDYIEPVLCQRRPAKS